MTDENKNGKIHFALEAWKKTIEVQQHFNTIEMQIRNLAITVLTATIGAAALVYNRSQETALEAIKAGTSFPPSNTSVVFGLFSPADMIVGGGLVAWIAFYFMDRWWYHRLLQGAVTQAQIIENKLREDLPYADLIALSNAIRLASHIKIGRKREIRSDTKIDIFYGVIAVVLILIIAFVF